MRIDTVKESSWLSSIWRAPRKNTLSEPEKPGIGIMSFEVLRLMTKVANLWQCLSDKQMARLQEELTNSPGIHKLVSDDLDYLMDLALSEIIDNLRCVAKGVARLGKKCVDPIYHNLEHVFDNPFEIDHNWCGWEYRLKKMERRVKKMKRFAAVTSQLYEELEVLSELENSLRRMQANNVNRMKFNEFHQKVMWQREEVSGLREMSTWVRTYDYVVRLLLRSLFTVIQRMKVVFRFPNQTESPEIADFPDRRCFVRSNSISAFTRASVYPSESSFGRSVSNLGDKLSKKLQIHYPPPVLCGKYPPMKGCITSKTDYPVLESSGSMKVNGMFQNDTVDPVRTAHVLQPRLLKTQKLTLGDAALALHYANVIIYIERLAMSPHFISPDAREALYDMLTTSIKDLLRHKLSLFSQTKASSVYSRGLASDWSSSMRRMLDWLVPLARNMTKWHGERNFEKQHMDSGSNVLLVTTLYYADQAKSEDTITELLMGLHYISRFGREINAKAFMGSACGRDCDDYLLHKGKIASIAL